MIKHSRVSAATALFEWRTALLLNSVDTLDLHPGDRVVGTVISIADFPWIWTFGMGACWRNCAFAGTLRSHTKVLLLLSTFASDFADRFDLLLSVCDSGLA